MSRIGVLGAGTWGVALARLLANRGHAVTLWSALPAEIESLRATHAHPHLPGVVIPEEIGLTAELAEACRGADLALFAVPSVYVRKTARAARPYLAGVPLIADAAKGIEADTLMTLSEVIRDELGDAAPVAALSGPTHAEEVARDQLTAITAACGDEDAARAVQAMFMTPFLRVYTNTDIRGVELCGALKNIVALAAGICDGLGHGDNAKAALITRGLAEMERLGRPMGASEATFAGLAGMGDLIVTCTSRHSRNHNAGELIGRGLPVAEAVRQVGMVVEGLNALPAAVALSKKYGAEMPIVQAVDDIVSRGADPAETVRGLMLREGKNERT